MKAGKRKIIYSNKEHTKKGIFSSLLALVSFLTLCFLIVMSYRAKGEISPTFGAIGFMCTLFSSAGIIIGLMGKNEPDKFYLFAYIGIIWNVIDLLFVSAILYAGI
ncbi:MAG: DUF6142 family protein [Lachnospiraceae bacterium]|nr:DUF6142 family protein [Lachnospiraceae bacterium]